MKKWVLYICFCFILGIALFAGGMNGRAEEMVFFDDTQEAALMLREQMKNRNSFIALAVKATDGKTAEEQLQALKEDAFENTGSYLEGDALRFSYWYFSATPWQTYVNDQLYYCYDIKVDYLTTIEQEKQLNSLLDKLMARFDFSGADDAAKARAIYSYICSNIRFEDLGFGITSNGNITQSSEVSLLKYTAYGALTKKAAVCQGFSLLYYQMALRAGLSVCLVTGTANDGDHMWPIVKIDGTYYHLDPAWDAGNTVYQYFLKSEQSFSLDHKRDARCSASAFKSIYPISQTDYSAAIASVPFLSQENDFVCSEVEGGLCIDLYTGKDSFITVPDSIDGKKIVKIGDNAFYALSAVKEVLLPAGVKEIGAQAFNTCSSLISIGLPDGLETIGSFAFAGCASLEQVMLPSGLKTIDDGAFARTGLTSVDFPDGLETIGNSSFIDTAITQVYIPATVMQVGSHFSNSLSRIEVEQGNIVYFSENGVLYKYEPDGKCSLHIYPSCCTAEEYVMPSQCVMGWPQSQYLKKITLSPDFSYGEPLFLAGSCLESIFVPEENPYLKTVDGVVYSKDMQTLWVFPPCLAVEELVIPEGVAEIRYGAFRYTKYLKKVVLPASIQIIDFSSASNLETVIFSKGTALDTIPEACFAECQRMQHITLPDGIKSIQDRAFFNTSLISIDFPDTLQSIGQNAFWGAFLQSVSLPSSIQYVGDGAFSYISTLTNIMIDDGAKGISNTAFLSSNCKEVFPVVLGSAGGGAQAYAEKVFLPFEDIANQEKRSFERDEYVIELLPTVFEKTIYDDNGNFEEILNCYDGYEMVIRDKEGKRLYTLLDENFSIDRQQVQILDDRHTATYTVTGRGAWRGTIDIVKDCRREMSILNWEKPSCEKEGHVTEARCETCGLRMNNESLPARGHNHQVIEIIPATLQNDGSIVRGACSTCAAAGGEMVIQKDNVLMLPLALDHIGASAFAGTAAQQITVSDGFKTIDSKAFGDSAKLMLVILPDDVGDIALDAFDGTPQVVLACNSEDSAHAYADKLGMPCFSLKH